MTLRQDKVEKHLAELKRNVNLTNTYETAESCNTGVNEREIDSLQQIKRMLANLDNAQSHQPAAVLTQQAHYLNFKKQ